MSDKREDKRLPLLFLITQSLFEKWSLRRSGMFIATDAVNLVKLRRSGIYISPLTGLELN